MTQPYAIDFRRTRLLPGFWADRQRTVRDVTVYAVEKQFRNTGRFDAFRFAWKPGMPNQPHIFWDSDIAKWIETAAYVLEEKADPALEASVDEVVANIAAHQEANGYFNIYFTVAEPENRFQKRTEHELYCAGHMMEAALAYHAATGKRQLLDLMEKYADCIYRVFLEEKSAGFVSPGHEEIELALVKMYRATGKEKYREMARYFLDIRGTAEEEHYPWANALYDQAHLPVREQTTAEGHSVRAGYLYAGMADMALEDGDEGLREACRTIFRDIALRKMYITGGIGSAAAGEGFSIPYDLPNETAYSETCAAIALALLARRMTLLDPDGIYADAAERAMYNGALSGISLDGKSFFYENPLEIHPALRSREPYMLHKSGHLPITERLEVFGCSCCPPNITRFIAAIADCLYSAHGDTLFVHHYMASETVPEAGVTLRQETDYPHDGKIVLTLRGGAFARVALRIPGWAAGHTLTVNGRPAENAPVKGYVYADIVPGGENVVELVLPMDPVLMEADPRVDENAGRAALQRGPIVYCLEAVDNGEGLRDIRIDTAAPMEAVYDPAFGACRVLARGCRRDPAAFDGLYRRLGAAEKAADLVFIPYYAFANRGESEMLVWVRY